MSTFIFDLFPGIDVIYPKHNEILLFVIRTGTFH